MAAIVDVVATKIAKYLKTLEKLKLKNNARIIII
jgi:hypothetical protein